MQSFALDIVNRPSFLLAASVVLSLAVGSLVPLAVFLVAMASFYKPGTRTRTRTRAFDWLLKRFVKIDMTNARQDIVDTVLGYQRYQQEMIAWNNHKLNMFKRIGWDDQKQAKEIGYLDHLQKVENCIIKNGLLARDIAKNAIQKYDITDLELKAGFYKHHSKIIESVSHFTRDWTDLGDVELKPILDYVKLNIDKTISKKQRSKTLVIVPGSGLGRFAHELSIMEPKFANVQSVEFSSTMFVANEFIYSQDLLPEYELYPYIHTYSHHTSAENQMRSTLIRKQIKPENLTMNLADIRTFQVSDMGRYDNVLVVTAFFIDTAQNLFEYFQAIERLIGDKNGTWINVGPLKYGTAPRVEFTLEELRRLRKIRGWKDLDEPQPYGSEISGYLTDTKGLWQGFYGLGRWTSSFKRRD